ncbi:LytTR family transcriptional regulator DNA-binding domain-containing protein [Telmatospirillum sp.]|uniref:LytTR family transcriptional regulator DNA-binding domain-containing protein n=1 Tax=Telmatospirillum sp. TaxID=2079197 RepID=UPI0028420EA5|nr:LytTR family transcriptional regulator DNA-binding domain-containing protein [Telmatospirillum sp.]MDR3441340.1 LytTR family transcriptional regulator DNA-binding domain-containing protein [Telmatospirillum sp.]
MPESPPTSFQYRLQQIPVGVVTLDGDRRVVSASPLAAALLSKQRVDWLGADILDLHPAQARTKVQWLLDTAEASPQQPAGMVLNLPDGTLISRVTVTEGIAGRGFCLLFYATEAQPATLPLAEPTPWLLKLPLSAHGGLALMDVADVIFLEAAGHYTQARRANADALCTLSLSELSKRLPPEHFLRVHRSYLVNLRHVQAIERRDDQWLLVMATDDFARIPVSRSNIDGLRRRLAV